MNNLVDKTKKDWEDRFEKGWEVFEDHIFADFLKTYKKMLGSKILDIGCGVGRHTIPLIKAGLDVTGLELTDKGLEILRAKLKNSNLKATLIQGDAHKLPFENESFDSAISIQVFQFNDWAGAKKCFEEVARILKKKGIFFLRVKSTAAKVPDSNVLIENDRGTTYRILDGNITHFFTLEEITELGKNNGLSIIGTPIDQGLNESEKGQWNVLFQKDSPEPGADL